jgi:two-component system, OmpR family, copper resistance phosphate regulon response regulator CusR
MTTAGTMPPLSPSAHLLIAEDDIPLAGFLQRVLGREHYAVDVRHDGEAALGALAEKHYDLLILDLNLPKIDGLSVLKQVRPTSPRLPVLVLTGRSRVEDRILTLDSGADDCLVKPFSFQELTARVRAILRRISGSGPGEPILVGGLTLNRAEFRAERDGKRIELTAREFSLLEYLMMNAPRPVTREMIMENVWRGTYDGSSNLVDVYIKYVRDKVDAGFSNKLVRTVRGVGYMVAGN